MFITTLSTDKWTGGFNDGYVIDHPTVEQVEAAIRELDGQKKTVVTLEAPDGSYLAIGGGTGGKYIVSGTYDDETFFDLVEANVPTDQDTSAVVRLVAGGQEVEYPARECSDLKSALEAARAFAVDGIFAPSLNWERQ